MRVPRPVCDLSVAKEITGSLSIAGAQVDSTTDRESRSITLP